MSHYRIGRVRQEILREVNEILRREVKDPRVQGVTITDVDITGDLQDATIYYSTLSDYASEREKTQKGLDSISGLVRSKLGERLSLYKTPSIKFERDGSIEYGNRIDQLINEIHEKDHEA